MINYGNTNRSSRRQTKKVELWKSVEVLLKKHNKTRVGGSVASNATSDAKKKIIIQFLKQLKSLGFQLSVIQELKERHVIAIAKFWEKQKYSPSTIQTRMSIIRVLCNLWLQKPGMIRKTEYYFSSNFNVRRTQIATVDKSWLGKDVDFEKILSKVSQIDIYVAIELEIMHAFGLRKKEAIMFQPHLSDHGILIKITRGAKTGKQRVIPVFSECQKEVLQRARLLIKLGENLANPNKSLKQNLRRFDYVVAKAGITKKVLGITSHGLRHGNSQNEYLNITGEQVPVKTSSRVVDKGIDKQARQEIAENLGHSRISITNSYFGKK